SRPFASTDLEGRLDLDRHTARQRAVADRGAGMSPGIPEHLDHQVGRTVDDLRHVGEFRRAVHKAAEPQTPTYPVEFAAARGLELGEPMEGTKPRRLPPLFDGNPGAELADMAPLAVPDADLAGDEHQIAGDRERHVIGDGRGRLRQVDAELLELHLDSSAHRRLSVAATRRDCFVAALAATTIAGRAASMATQTEPG